MPTCPSVLCKTWPVFDAPAGLSSDDVLAQPSRARLFELLLELRRAAGTAELATRLGLHANGVRVHLGRLEEAGLVARAQVRRGRGRPADAWMIAPDARPGGQAPRAYRDLGRWLARSLGERSVTTSALERTGREIGRELAPSDGIGGLEAVERALAALGFQPAVSAHGSGRVTFCLGNCPYRDVVREYQPAICALHKGITRGLLDELAPEAKLSGFVPHDPDQAGCLIELRGASWSR